MKWIVYKHTLIVCPFLYWKFICCVQRLWSHSLSGCEFSGCFMKVVNCVMGKDGLSGNVSYIRPQFGTRGRRCLSACDRGQVPRISEEPSYNKVHVANMHLPIKCVFFLNIYRTINFSSWDVIQQWCIIMHIDGTSVQFSVVTRSCMLIKKDGTPFAIWAV